MESSLFTELTLTEQETLSGGKKNKQKVKVKQSNKIKQFAAATDGGAAVNFGLGLNFADTDAIQQSGDD